MEAGRRGPSPSGLGVDPASHPLFQPLEELGDQPAVLWGGVNGPQLSEGHLTSDPEPLQHMSLDSALPPVGISPWEIIRDVHHDSWSRTAAAAFFVTLKTAPTQCP